MRSTGLFSDHNSTRYVVTTQESTLEIEVSIEWASIHVYVAWPCSMCDLCIEGAWLSPCNQCRLWTKSRSSIRVFNLCTGHVNAIRLSDVSNSFINTGEVLSECKCR